MILKMVSNVIRLLESFIGLYTGLFIINGGRNSYDPVEIFAKKLRKLNETYSSY